MNSIEPNIHETGCAMAHTSRLQTIFPQECRSTIYVLPIFLLKWKPFPEVWPHLVFLTGHLSSYECTLLRSPGYFLELSKVLILERALAALTQGFGFWCSSTLYWVATYNELCSYKYFFVDSVIYCAKKVEVKKNAYKKIAALIFSLLLSKWWIIPSSICF